MLKVLSCWVRRKRPRPLVSDAIIIPVPAKLQIYKPNKQKSFSFARYSCKGGVDPRVLNRGFT